MAGSSCETFPTLSTCTHEVGNIKVEEDGDVIEENFKAINEADLGIKQEEIPQDITFPDIKAEPDNVSYVYICLFLDTFYMCPIFNVSIFYDIHISAHLRQLPC
jgi:hypothetical protein